MHSNSIAAYYGTQALLSKRAAAVLEFLQQCGPATDRQVMLGLGFSEPNSVRPRITELMEAGLVIETGSTRCTTTGKTVRLVDVQRNPQGLLFS